MNLLLICLFLVRALPAEPGLFFSRVLVIFYLLLRPDYRNEIRSNYRAIFGVERPLFWLHNGWCIGKNLWLMARIGTPFTGKIIDRTRIYGENIKNGERRLHILMVSFHYGVWELLPQIFTSRGVDTGIVVARPRERSLDKVIFKIRKTGGVKLITGWKTLLARLRGGEGITGFMLDNTSQGKQCWVNLPGGIGLRIPVLPFRLGRLFNYEVVPLFAYFARGRVRVKLFPPGDELGASQALITMVRKHPEEWIFWGKSGGLRN